VNFEALKADAFMRNLIFTPRAPFGKTPLGKSLVSHQPALGTPPRAFGTYWRDVAGVTPPEFESSL
jgi:hypothetical protein